VTDAEAIRQRMLGGQWFRARGAFDDEYRRASELQQRINATATHETELRGPLLEQLLGSIGADTEIRPPLHVDFGSNISIGSSCFVNFGLVALDCAAISIGDRANIASNVQLVPPDHPLERTARGEGYERALAITIGDDVWIGAGAIVLGGVTIGDGAVIGAGAVVTSDIPADSVAVGVPARVVRSLADEPRPPDLS
jgi:maltose O-acetyltransferase